MRLTGPVLCALSLSAILNAADDKTDRETLRGIKSVCVVVEISNSADGRKTGLTSQSLQAVVEGRIRQTDLELDKDAKQCLYLNVRPLQALGQKGKPVGLYAISFSLEFMQTVALTRQPAIKSFAATWSTGNLATVSVEDVRADARQIAVDLADRFLEAYRSVNPK